MENNRKFDGRPTVEYIINIQTEQLANWKLKLNDNCYNALEAWAVTSNEGKTEWNSILRGSNLDNFIANWKHVEVTDDKKFHTLGFCLSSRDETNDLYVEKIDDVESFKEDLEYKENLPQLKTDDEAINIARSIGLYVDNNGKVVGADKYKF